MILLPKNEQRKFKYGKLKNGLKYTIIQDNATDMTNVVMNVRTGSFYEPKEYMGLAHFLEHMLFLGSDKYKDEKLFLSKLNDLGGEANAYTDLFETVYYFTVVSNNLKEIIDIFSRFFIDPLFNENSVSREINAVNSEHMKNINSDIWVVRYFINSLTKSNNNSNRFTTGSLETLGNDIDKLRQEMIKFYKKYYCSNNMCLTITSNKLISEIEELISCFEDIKPNKDNTHPNFDEGEKFSSTLNEYILKPVRDNNYIIYYWDVKSIFDYLYDNTLNIIDYVIELNAENNLNNILIKSSYSTGISTDYLYNGIYMVTVYLSPNIDLKKGIYEINKIICNYFNNLHNYNWKLLYKYLLKVDELNYENSTKQDNLDLAIHISTNMHYFNEKNIYNGRNLVIKENFDKIFNVLSMLVFEKANIIYVTKEKLCKNEMNIMKHYNKKYCKISNSFLNNDIFNFTDLKINKSLLNINPHVIDYLDKYNIPIKLTNNFWYGGVSKFNEPIVYGYIYINYKKLYNTPISALITSIAINIINYYINILFFQELAMGYSIYFSQKTIKGNIYLSIQGYNYHYINFFNYVINKIKTIIVSNDIIKLFITKEQESILNVSKLSPWEYINLKTQELMFDYVYSYEDYLKVFNKTSESSLISMIISRIKKLIHFNDLPILTIIYGNCNKKKLNNTVTFNKNSDIKMSSPIYSKINLLRDNKTIILKHPNSEEKNKCVQFILRYNNKSGYNFDPLISAQFLILQDMITKPVFNELRTKQQLGYLVNGQMVFDGNYYIRIKVQSHLNVNHIESKINDFLLLFIKILNDYNINDFNVIKTSIYSKLNSKHSNMSSLFTEYSTEIYSNHYLFNRRILVSNMLNKIQLNDIKQLYHSIIRNKYIIKLN